MRPDHAPIVDVALRCTADFRDDALRARYFKAHADQVQRNEEREWRAFVNVKPTPELPTNVLRFGAASKDTA